jgi:hypothetical protein
MTTPARTTLAIATTLIALAFSTSLVSAQTTTTRPAYGCFKVSSSDAVVRASASKTGNVIANVIKGETLVKRRRFCTVGGAWCPVTTNKGLQGFAAKADIVIAPCPSRTSTKVN